MLMVNYYKLNNKASTSSPGHYDIPNSYTTLSNGRIKDGTQRSGHDLIDILPLNVHEGTEEKHTHTQNIS
jgi:hypothetical protein